MSKKLWCRKCKSFEIHDSRSKTRIEQLVDKNIAIEMLAKDRYCTMQARIEQLEAVVEVAREVCADDDSYYNVTHELQEALAVLEKDDE